jgi:hypothetical protein
VIEETTLERLSRRVRQVFKDHKTEMLIAGGIGFVIGAVMF